MSAADHTESKLKHFPITFIPSVMGLTGLAIVFFKAQHMLHLEWPLAKGLLFGVSAWFLFILVAYGLKTAKYTSEAVKDFQHPIRVNFFPGISICFLLGAIAYTELGWFSVAKTLCWIGAPLHLLLLLVILHGWFHKPHKLPTFNPAWFIPVVGPLLVPVVGCQFANPEISWFFFAVGLIYWLTLMAVLLNRLFFHDPLPVKLLPTLFILIAPPAVGFIAYVKLTGNLDAFARILLYFGIFTGLMLLTMVGKFRKVPFFLSWWGYTFPLASLTLSLFLMFQKSQLALFKTGALVMTAVTTLVVLWVLFKTLQTAIKGDICIPED